MLVAMFSLLAATLVIGYGRRSLGLTRFNERTQQQQLRAKAEVNRLLAEMSVNQTTEPYADENRTPQEVDGTSWRSWVVQDENNPAFVHLHAEVWDTSVGPPGQRFSRVVKVEPAKKQLRFVQTSDGSTNFRLSYSEDGVAAWNSVANPFSEDPSRARYFESFDGDDSGGIFVAQVDEDRATRDDKHYKFQRFDTGTSSWETLPAPPGGVLASVSYADGKVAALTRSSPAAGHQFDRVSVYDVESETWTTLPTPPSQFYDSSGNLKTAAACSTHSYGLDIDNDGNIFVKPESKEIPTLFMPSAAEILGEGDHQTAIYKWNGDEWSILPVVPPTLLPSFAVPITARPPVIYNYKQIVATGDGGVAFTWLPLWDVSTGGQRFFKFDGEQWSRLPQPSYQLLYGEPQSVYNPYSGITTQPDPDGPVAITSLASNLDGEVYVSNTEGVATLQDLEYEGLEIPSYTANQLLVHGAASASRPIEGEQNFRPIVSF